MSQKQILEITTDDTKKTYQWVNGKAEGEIPQLVKIRCYVTIAEANGTFRDIQTWQTAPVEFILERSTIDKTELFKHIDDVKLTPPPISIADLLRALLLEIGVKFDD